MSHLKGCLAVVTGGSSGIGAAIVKDLLNAGLIVIALARRVERVIQLRNSLSDAAERERLHALKCDVANATEIAEVFTQIAQKYGTIRVLINNAGCLHTGQLCTMDSETIQQVLQTNVMGVVNCTRHAFKAMHQQQQQQQIVGEEQKAEEQIEGHVILINSVFGHHVAAIPGYLPALNIYPATKYALTAMNEVYRQEFKELGTKIKVTSISPGLVNTDLISDEQKNVCDGKILQPEDVSRAVMFALTAPAHVQVYEVILKPFGDII